VFQPSVAEKLGEEQDTGANLGGEEAGTEKEQLNFPFMVIFLPTRAHKASGQASLPEPASRPSLEVSPN
jgi:hypothetical protein